MNEWLRHFLSALLIVLPVAAQQPRFAELHRMFPAGPDDDTRAVAATDIDGDGDVDFVFGDFGQDRLFLNDGLGLFTDAPVLPIDNDSTTSVVAGDLDGNGTIDIVFGQGMGLRLVLQVAPFAFFDAVSNLPPGTAGATALALGDVDGDGDLDLMIASANNSPTPPRLRLWLNNGAAVFTDVTATHVPAFNPLFTLGSISLGDADGDGDLDAFVAGSGAIVLLRNNGSGSFSTLPAAPPGFGSGYAGVFGDLDGDGDLDLAIADGGSGGGYAEQNLGNGAFFGPYPFPPGYSSSGFGVDLNIVVGDLDHDGDGDVVLANSGGAKAVYLSTPTGFVAVPNAFPPVEMEATYGLALADVDGDQDLDLVGAGGGFGPNRLYLNDGTGRFGDSGSPGPWKTSTGVVGDVDGDGDPDLFTGSSVWKNDGTGTFTEFPALVPPMTLPWHNGGFTGMNGPALGDLNGDGWLDAMGGSSSGSLLLLNNGAGGFVDHSSQISQLNAPAYDAWLADVDQDGDLDSFVNGATGFGTTTLYVNNGAAFFAPSAFALPANNPAGAFAFGDFDGDSDVDVYRVTLAQDRLWLNNGAGAFTDVTATNLPVENTYGTGAAAGDVDFDGDLDLLVGSHSATAPAPPMLLLNDGTAHFTSAPTHLPPCLASTWDLKLVDLDGDADLDAVLGNVPYPQYSVNTGNLVWLNDGTGHFTDAPWSIPFSQAYQLGVVDLDGDGDVDIMAIGQYLRVFYNQNSHVSWRTLPRIGKHLWLDVAGSPNGSWCIAADTSSTSVSLPGLGLLHLNPATATFFGCGALDSSGRVAIGMTVPPIPALIGVPYYVQALVGFPPRLTNMEIVTCSGL